MSDRVVQSFHDCDGKDVQSRQSYHSVWMAHWMPTSCHSAPQIHNHLSGPLGKKEEGLSIKQCHLPSGVEIASGISIAAIGFKEVEGITPEMMDGSLSTSSKKLNDERLRSAPFPMANFCQNCSTSVSKNDQGTSHMQALRSQVENNFGAPLCISGNRSPLVLAESSPATENLSRECHLQVDGMSENPAGKLKSHKFHGDSSLTVARPLRDDFMPYRFKHGENRFDIGSTAVPAFLYRQEETKQLSTILASKEQLSSTGLTILEHEHCNFHRQPAFLVHDKKMDDSSYSKKSVTPYLMQNTSLLLRDPSTSTIRLLPSRFTASEATNSAKSYAGGYSLQRTPHSVHDMEAMRICTAVNSVEGLSGGPPGVSQTTHSFFIAKKTDAQLSIENQIFRESKISTQLDGNTFSEFHNLSPPFCHVQRGEKLQPLGGSTDDEGKNNVEDFKASGFVSHNESSAETDTMNMDAVKEKNHLSDVNSSPANEDIMVGPNPPPQNIMTSAREDVEYKRCIAQLPDINLKPAVPAASSLMENVEPSTSQTQSLDEELLLSHVETACNQKSNPCPETRLRSEPSSRWVKRLKLSASDTFALGTKSSNLGEPSSHENVHKFFNKIMKGSISGSELMLGKRHVKEVMALDRTAALSRDGESSSADAAKNGRDVMLSHSWIKRWRRSQASTSDKKPEAVVVYEPESTKLELEELQKKQFPSIAAMALMGKAVSGFQPCEFQKRGSIVVWNTKGL